MNELNEILRVVRIQIAVEKNQPNPDQERINELKKEEQKCLELLRE